MEEIADVDELSDQLITRAERVAGELRAQFDLEERLGPYRPLMATDGSTERPTLHLDDISAIPFVDDVPGVEEYPQRAWVRALPGDAVALPTEVPEGYRRYNREFLGLWDVEAFVAEPSETPHAVAESIRTGAVIDDVIDWARRQGRIRLEPFMASEPVWELADVLAEAGADVEVRGPPPPVLWIANDKLRMTRVVERLFEERRSLEVRVESEPVSMVDALFEVADEASKVALKRTRCASAMGNLVFDRETLEREGRDGIERRVREFLEHTRWPEGRDVQICRWLDVEVSPSTQGWIPAGDDPPYVDGVYEQLLDGEANVFLGSRPVEFGEPLRSELLETSLAMLETFRRLGYRGRCSFDFVVTGEPPDTYELRVVDCNGRWGGTSMPMQLVDRMVEGPRPSYRAQDYVDPDLSGCEFRDVVEACRDHLYRRETGEGRFILYNPGPVAEYGKFDVISFGENQRDARDGVTELLPELLDRVG